MTAEPSCTVFFCEDIRYEKDEKTSYIGMIGSDIGYVGSKELLIPQLYVVTFVHWAFSFPPVDWRVEVTTPNGKKGRPFLLPPRDAENLIADPDTGLVVIMIHTKISPLVASGGTKILVELIKAKKRVTIGALRFSRTSTKTVEVDHVLPLALSSPKRRRRVASG